MQKQIFQQLAAHPCAADVSRDQHRRIKRNPHFFFKTSKTSSSVLIPPACARATNLVRSVRNSATRRKRFSASRARSLLEIPRAALWRSRALSKSSGTRSVKVLMYYNVLHPRRERNF